MRRSVLATILATAALAVGSVFAVQASAATSGSCTMTNANESITNTGGSFRPTVHFIVSCTNQSTAWAITSWCSKSADGGATWAQCANTNQITQYGNGDASFGVPVGNTSWGCVGSTIYRGKSEFGNLSAATSVQTSLC